MTLCYNEQDLYWSLKLLEIDRKRTLVTELHMKRIFKRV